jgi:carbonic anhydrase
LRRSALGWRALRAPDGWRRDLGQGLTLAAWTLSISALLAALSGISLASALVATAVGSVFSVMLGGAHVGLSGPGLTTGLISASILHDHGVSGFGLVVLFAGAFQVFTGALGLGRLVRLVPLPVIRGYVMGTGAVLIVFTLPLALGAPVDGNASLLQRIDLVGAHLPQAEAMTLAIAAGAVLVTLLARWRARVPAAFAAIVLASVVASLYAIDTPTIQSAPHFPWPALPGLPSRGIATLAGGALALWVTATLETALSTAALERMSERRQDPDQELIANGLATCAMAFLGGVPTTQLIARSAIGLPLGVTSRRPALVQAITVLAVAVLAWRWLHLVPTAALGAVAVVAGVLLLEPRPIRDLARVSHLELAIAAATVVFILVGGLVQGVVVGASVAIAAATARLVRTRAVFHASTDTGTAHHVSFSGPLTFIASLELDSLREKLDAIDATRGLVVDLRNVLAIDGTAADGLLTVVDAMRARGGKVALLGPSVSVRQRMQRADEHLRQGARASRGPISEAIAPTDRELERILGGQQRGLARPHLLAGVERFREQMRDHYDSLFAHLADGQHPHTMFVTCADSRVQPSLLTGAHPGDLFIVRCIGALVAPAGSEAMPQEGAAIEYGVGVLGIRHIVICGHSKCGAVSALMKGKVPAELATLGAWMQQAHGLAGELGSFEDTDEAARAITVRQLDHVRSYPLVRDTLARGDLTVHAWFYDLEAVEVFEWDEARKRYDVLGAPGRSSMLPDAG